MSLATELGVPCPFGYTEAEMQTRNLIKDPCYLCGKPVPRYVYMRQCDCLMEH